MIKLKTGTSQGPISHKVITSIKKQLSRKVIHLSEFRSGKILAEQLEQTVISNEKFSQYDPLHAIYLYAQNKLAVLMEQTSELPALRKLENAYFEAEERYMPSGPPMSPLTRSYFTCWGSFDLNVGIKKETFGSVIIDLCKALDSDPDLIQVFEAMQHSRMGIYIHEGHSNNHIYLRELVTGRKIECLSPAGYLGIPDEIWYVRVLPEPLREGQFGYSLIFNTPYVLAENHEGEIYPASEKNWLDYFERSFDKMNISDRNEAYENLMKYGFDRYYWNEFIFEGYVNHTQEMVLLAGFPDMPASRPHSSLNQ